MNKNSGFTLIEILVTIAIAAVTLSYAVSGFRSVIVTNRVATEVNDFVAGLNLARSEAVKRARNVGIVASGGSWAAGWDIRVDANGDGDVTDAGDTILRSWRSSGEAMAWANNNAATEIVVDARGGIGTATRFTVSPSASDCPAGLERVRDVSISISGHISISKAACN